MLKTRLLTASALVTIATIAAPAAFAQTDTVSATGTAPTNAQCAADPGLLGCSATNSTGADGGSSADEGQVVTVTGSRIRRPGAEAAVPTTSIGGEEFFQQGQNSIGDTLNDLPQLRSTFAQQNPGAGVGITGLNLLDLRGLGTVRTLVLVNGRRHVPADILNNASSPDVNTISEDLIERVEIITGGSSAVYGSDAIAGVVNFILRRDFDGLQLRGSTGISEKGYGGNQFVSAMAGKNFAGGRGNITVQAEYARQDRIYASDIPMFRTANGLVGVDTDSGGLANGSDGFPDAVYLRDIRSSSTHRYGLAGIPQPNTTGLCGAGTLANNGPPNNLGTAFTCNFIFDAAGRLTPQTGTRVGSGPAGTYLGGNGQTSREGTQLSILPFNEHYNANLLAHYEFSPAFEAFVEAKYSRVNTVGNQLGPTFLNNSTASLRDGRIDPRLDNPFLNSADRATIANGYRANNCTFATNTASSYAATTCIDNTPTVLGPNATAAQIAAEAAKAATLAARNAAITNGSYRFLFARNLTDLPDRDEVFRRDTYRIVGGFRGTFNDDWNYEVSANYGKFKEVDNIKGFVNLQRFLLSLDSGLNPNTNTIQCRSQFVPAAAVGAPGYTNSAATLAADIAACVPYNPFGAPNNSAAVNYFNLAVQNRSSLSQLDFQGFVGGDLSQLFELPGGPIRFVLGGEYRREKAVNDSDDAADTGISNGVFLGDVNSPALKVKEAYGELQIPILKDVPFFHELTITGAGRVSDYNTAVGTVYTYNGGVEWAPVRDLRLRGNYGRAIRAPNVTENAFPNVPNFANAFVDPCSANVIGQNAIRNTNCTTQLSAAQLATIPNAGYSLGVISGSNPNVKEETSDSYTIGAVLTPRFLPGFSLTADYFDIKVKNVIVSLAAQTIVNSCYDSPNLSNPLCNAFQRNLTGNGQITNNTVFQGPQNFAKRIRRGLDVEGAYRTNLSENFKLSTRMIYTHTFQNSNFENPALPNFENRLLSEIGDPKDEFRWNVDVATGPLTVGYIMRYIGPQLTSAYENFYALDSACTAPGPSQVCPPLNADAIEPRSYGSVLYHNLRFAYDLSGPSPVGTDGNFSFYVGVDNLTNRKPPLGTTATGAGTAIFNIRGRNYYAGFRAKF